MSRFFLLLAMVMGLAGNAVAQDLSALARVQAQASSLVDRGKQVHLRLSISQPVPYRIFTLDEPRRLVIDFNEVDWTALSVDDFDQSEWITGIRTGIFIPGWSRMVMDLDTPFAVSVAGLETKPGGDAEIRIELIPTSASEFATNAGAPLAAQFRIIDPPPPTDYQRQNGSEPLVVVLDPGHGGIDPGAEAGDTTEATLMLRFARELQELLLRSGEFKVVMTRENDEFVPLEARISIAHEAQADVFLSLHADALVEGRASGATIYTLSEDASDAATRKLAERHDRTDLLSGVDLRNQDDVIATVLMDLARAETAPRSEKLAQALVAGLSETIRVHKRPHLYAGFSVLKSPVVPSALIELGFLSSKRDRERLLDDDWRAQAAIGIRNALLEWRIGDAADAQKLRK